jgi:plasmid stabilization system protein ParE
VRFRLARAAERDIETIGDWIARDDPDAAARFTAELETTARRIVAMPYAFPAVGAANTSLRKRSYRGYIIYYQVSRTTVTVTRILHHARDEAGQLRTS